jgi:hypothetical protein
VPHVATPLQPVNKEPTAGVAVSVNTDRLGLTLAAQMSPQFIPAGLLVTVPVPVPVFVTDITTYPGATSKFAVMFRSSVMVTVQGPVPLQPPPLQPVKSTPAFWLAVNVTALPAVKVSEQSVPQLIPAGMLLTTPLAANGPVLVTDSRRVVVKDAETVLSVSIRTVQDDADPLQAPPQPANVEPVCGTAVSSAVV